MRAIVEVLNMLEPIAGNDFHRSCLKPFAGRSMAGWFTSHRSGQVPEVGAVLYAANGLFVEPLIGLRLTSGLGTGSH